MRPDIEKRPIPTGPIFDDFNSFFMILSNQAGARN